jgi:hypothetical protein
MTLIRKKEELQTPTTVKAMIYGQAGMGKTTLALSAPRPLLLDFDGGAHRVNYGHQTDTVPIGSWDDAMQVLQENLSAYQTIVVDTIGKMLDYIEDKADRGRIGGFKKWTYINDQFKLFTRTLTMSGKTVIFVAHRDTRKEGDETVFVPAMREKNYSSIVTELDLLGYLEMTALGRTVTFNPTARNDGKNTCNLPEKMQIPLCVDSAGNALKNDFFTTQIVAPYIANLEKRRAQSAEFEETMQQIKSEIDFINDAYTANLFVSNIDKFTHVGSSKQQAGILLKGKAAELGLKLNKEKLYENAI